MEKADFRAQALAALATRLSPDDEPFLEAALDDRSQAVRAEAARLLARLPTSALAGRMRERADRLLGYTPHKRGLFRAVAQAFSGNAARGDLAVILPETLDLSWQRDGIEPKPRAGIGERAWWLLHALAAVAPGHWSARFAASPTELVAAAKGHEWGQAVLEGWTRAAITARDGAWVPPLWHYWVDLRAQQQGVQGPMPELLRGLLDTMSRDRLVVVALESLGESTRAERPLWIDLAPLLPTPWDPALGRRYLEATRERLRSFRTKYNDPWLSTLEIAARALPPETFVQARADWQIPEGLHRSPHEWQRHLARFTTTIALRQQLMKEIAL